MTSRVQTASRELGPEQRDLRGERGEPGREHVTAGLVRGQHEHAGQEPAELDDERVVVEQPEVEGRLGQGAVGGGDDERVQGQLGPARTRRDDESLGAVHRASQKASSCAIPASNIVRAIAGSGAASSSICAHRVARAANPGSA